MNILEQFSVFLYLPAQNQLELTRSIQQWKKIEYLTKISIYTASFIFILISKTAKRNQLTNHNKKMEKLSSEIVIDILSRLPIKSLVRCRDLEDPVSVVVGFGFLPKMNVYKVVEIVYYKREIVDDDLRSNVYVYTMGDDNSWRHIGSSPYSLRGRYFSEAFVDGAVHWVSSGYDGPKLVDRIVAFDLENEVFRVIPHPDFDSGRLNYTLGVLQGCLSATRYKVQDYVEIWIMKDYGVKESWTKCLKIVCSEVGLMIGAVQPLLFPRNGEVMLQHGGTLFCYNPLTKKLRELRISGMPRSFKAFIHVGSLVSPRKLLKFENTEFA
ncbi:F-box protein At3g07870-like [Lycium ferocissimum]|uniref:F-box protein At3g07870-like n=1 Tax=Lycium ferocissimum TaxID=112874 RepID=UPI0028150670|nr:F-box protein At3g07870-like [Lycium ferocissimum]